MNAKEMHYDFKQKLNKIDSQKYRNLLVPEIDWKLNEAQEVFVKIVAEPRMRKDVGFEVNQRTKNDIRTIVVDQLFGGGVVPTSYDSTSYIAALPTDYWFLLGCKIFATKGNCANVRLAIREVDHDDENELSPFHKSSFTWRVSNVWFNKDGLRIFTDGTYSITKVCFEYLKKPRAINNSPDFVGGTYTDLQGNVLNTAQSCELPDMVHREIVDLAVLITAGDLNLPDYVLKQRKLALTS